MLICSCQNDKKSLNTIDRKGYSISYNSNLRLNESQSDGSEFSLLIPQEEVTGNFAENLNLIIQNLENTGVDLDKFVEISEGQIKTVNSTLLESKRCKLNGKEAQKLIYEGRFGDFDLKFQQYYIVDNYKAYILTYTAKKTHFDTYLGDMEATMTSFKLK